MKSIKISEAIRIVRPEYVFLKLKPNNSIRNNNTHKLARAISSLYKNALENVRKDEIKVKKVFGKQFFVPTKVSYEAPAKVAYYIYMEKKKIEFYFIVPLAQFSILREKMSDVWSNITIEEVDTLPEFGKDSTKLQLSYTKEDALSLAVDRRSNDLLTSTLNVIEVMEEGDKVGIFYNFMPTSQFSWRSQYRNTIEKLRNNKPVDRDKTGSAYLLKMAFSLLIGFTNAVAETLTGEKKKQETNLFVEALERMNGGKKVSEATQKKATASIIDTQIVVMSESTDVIRQRNNARSLAQSFDTISEPSGGNSLRYRPLRSLVNPTAYSIGAAVNKVGDEECSNFLAVPGRDILERYNVIEKVETQETEVPEDLRSGIMRIGTNTFRGVEQMAYLSSDKEYQFLTLVLIGPTRAGKSTLIGNLSYDVIKNKECAVIFDYIGSCQLSSEVAALFPSEKQLVIDCENPLKIQGLGYNEVGISADPFKQYDNAKKQATQLLTLINAVNGNGVSGDTDLSAKMERYLSSAALVVFVNGGSIRDVFSVLQNHDARREWLLKVPQSQLENLSEYMTSLEELDDYDKKGVEIVGTKDNLITGIIDRLNKLKANTFMEAMLKRSAAGNIDLVKELQKSQLITIRMPESMFATDGERDVYTTYWITKLWLALQIREQQMGGDRSKLTKVNLVIDELYQVANTQQFLSGKLSRLAKFGCKPIISAHYLNQIKYIRDELRSANASYMLISGCDKKNYHELSSELQPFTEEDLLNLPRYHSLNLIKDGDKYARFITKLPKPVSTNSQTQKL